MGRRIVGKRSASALVMGWLLCACQPGAQVGGTQTPPASSSPGTWTGTVTRTFRQNTNQSGGGNTATTSESYEATVEIRSTQVDVGAWTLLGTAKVKATRSIYSLVPVPCNEMHKDDATANGTVDVLDGGLEAADDRYEFWVQLADLPGSEHSVRTAGCGGGGNLDEAHEWTAGAGGTIGGSGSMTNPKVISGSSTTSDGFTVTTWTLTRTP